MSVLLTVASSTQNSAQITVKSPCLFAELIDCSLELELTLSGRGVGILAQEP